MNVRPSIMGARATALIALAMAVLGALSAFGVPITDSQSDAILALAGAGIVAVQIFTGRTDIVADTPTE